MASFTAHTTTQICNSHYSLPATMAIPNNLLLPLMTFRNVEFRAWRRRQLKPKPFLLPNDVGPLTQSTKRPGNCKVRGRDSGYDSDGDSNSRVSEIGEWILFTSPTSFNRFVLSRCPSISIKGGSIGELVKQERHYVRVDSGKIRVRSGDEIENRWNEEFQYQRVCVGAQDGGVICLDWPEHLDLTEECGLETTVLLIPGTAEGSMDGNVRSFAYECLKRGWFPIVMNPRGCAGSPLTTARLFTAADSDDVCSAIQFVTRARPSSVLMGIGWGHGSNMLTKYLAEAGEKTPLTAATCIDNPFDLDEATRTSPYSNTIDKKLTGGLIDILKSNKELFRGRGKNFDVVKAVSANSIRDFESAISMVSYGFDTLEEFYSKCSTKSVVGKLKIPVLFMQSIEGTVPLFSIPRGSIAENPFTSLLLSSCLPSNVTKISWCQQVTIEWLTAIELGLLKGHQPLLQDVDVTSKPSKGLALMEGRTSYTNGRLDDILNLDLLDSSYAYFNPMKETSEVLSKTNGAFLEISSDDTDSSLSVGHCLTNSDTGEVLQTKQVMNMLDETMPGTFKEKDKWKVLVAVSEGETIIKALLDAVPEEIHGKLIDSVSQFLRRQGNNEKANVSSGLKSKVKEHKSKKSVVKTECNNHPPDKKACGHELRDTTDSNQAGLDKLLGQVFGAQSVVKSLKTFDILESKPDDHHHDDICLTKGSGYPRNPYEILDDDLSAEEIGQLSEHGTACPEITASKEAGQRDTSQEDETDWSAIAEIQMPLSLGNHQDLCNDETETSSLADSVLDDVSQAPASLIFEDQLTEQEDNQSKSQDQKLVLPLPDQKTFDTQSHIFNVSEALDTLTGSDGSTQVAFNSLFEVIETMITHLEKRRNESTIKNGSENNDVITCSLIENNIDIEVQIQKQMDAEGDGQKDRSPLDMELLNGKGSDSSLKNISNESLNVDKVATNTDGSPQIKSLLFNLGNIAYKETLYSGYLRKYIFYNLQKARPLSMKTTSDLLLDYNPDKGDWRLLDEPQDIVGAASYHGKGRIEHPTRIAEENAMDDIGESPYVILDPKRQKKPAKDFELKKKLNDKLVNHDIDEPKFSVKTKVLESLKVELSFRLRSADIKNVDANLAADIEAVANAVYSAIQCDRDLNIQECSGLDENHITEAISLAVENTSYLKRVLPIGVIICSSLGALKNLSDVAAVHANNETAALDIDEVYNDVVRPKIQLSQEVIRFPTDRVNHDPVPAINSTKGASTSSSSLHGDDDENAQEKTLNTDALIVGAVTASLGASALPGSEEGLTDSVYNETSSGFSEEERMKNEPDKEVVDHKQQTSVVTSLAEKAMSVAAPVVPVREDGKVDQDRLVTMLAAFAQRDGMLRLVGKLALLWGSLRGAMSLTDRLISFLCIAERPLPQRVLGFSCMVLILWSPVLVPLFPTLFHIWATNTSSKLVELACILGFYAAVTILIMQWGKRIRGHEYPLEHYGLNLMESRKIEDLFIGFVGGVMLVLSIQSANALLGFVSLSWPSNLGPATFDVMGQIQVQGKVLLLTVQAILTATGIAFVEELLFRSWLLEEIAADLGYHPGIILSGLAFSLCQRSLQAIPGLWLLSICLVGARVRRQGSPFISIGLRTGILVSSYILQKGGYLIYQSNFRSWISGTHPFQPFSGIVGFLFAFLLAIVLYPRQSKRREKVIHEDITQ